MCFARQRAFMIGVAIVFCALAPASGFAADVRLGKLVIETPWTRATPGGAKVGAGYLAIINTGDTPDRLVSASTPIAERIEIHEMSMANGIMRMRPLDSGLELKPQTVTELKPGGYHLMFIGLKQPITTGDKFTVDVKFEQAGDIELTFEAAGIGATQAPGSLVGVPGGSASGGSHSGSHSGSEPHQGSTSGQPAQGSQSGAAPGN